MSSYVRYAEKFEDATGSQTLTFPTDDYEYSAEQAYRGTPATVVGADYAFDQAGSLPWPKDPGKEHVRFTIWGSTPADAESQFDDLVGTIRNVGLGKLYTLESDGSTRRWCWARLTGRPSYQSTSDSMFNIAVVCEFLRLSDWQATTATTGTQALTSSTTFNINNPGTAPVYPVFRLRSSTSSGFTNPVVSNQANGYSVSSTRDAASALDEIRIDADQMTGTVKYSSDDGATYSNDFSLVTLGANQRGIFRLEPGDNTIGFVSDGSPNLSFEWSFYAAYE